MNVQPTIGTEFSKLTVQVQDRTIKDSHTENISLQIWDTCNLNKLFNLKQEQKDLGQLLILI